MNRRLLTYATFGTLLAMPLLSNAAPQNKVSLDIAPPQAIQRAIRVGSANPNQVLHLAVSLPLSNPAAMEAFVSSVSDPASPNYRQFMTPEQVGQQFGLPNSKVQQVVDYLKSQGFNVTLVGKNHLSILADATMAQASKAFGVSFEQFQPLDTTDTATPIRFSFVGTPSVPASIASSILDISGMENFTEAKRQYVSPSQLRTLYSTATYYNSGKTGAGRTVGISSWDGFRLANAASFISSYGLPVPTAGALSNVTVTTVDGGSGTGAEKIEGDMDIQCTLAIAPLASIIVYDGYGGDLINVLTKEVNDNLADIITESYGWGLAATTAASAHNLHLSMSAQGITYLAAAGDTGTTISTYGYPDVDPEVLIVGGTSVTTDTTGNRTTETTWTSGGGGWQTTALSFNTKPSYQSAVGPSGVNYRLVPDIAANADANTGYYMYWPAGTYSWGTISTSGIYTGFGGTSAASPTMAASLAIAEQQIIASGGLTANAAGKQRFGRINDLLYSYNGNSSIFYDVTSGSNGTLPNSTTSTAAAGWDTATGWGALNFAGLVNQVLGITTKVASVSLSASTIEGGNGTTLTGTVTLNSAAPAGGQVITLTSSSTAVTVPASITIAAGASSGTFNVTTSTVATSTTATVTAAMSGSSATASLTLTVPHPSSLTLSSSSVIGGTSVTGTVMLAEAAPTGGLVVNLSSSSTLATVPATVTVAAGATSATFTVTTVASATAGTATITAASGNGSSTASLSISATTVKSLSLSGTSGYGGLGTVITGTVTLNGAAPSAGLTVALSSTSTSISLSATSISVASGKTTGTFTFTAGAVNTSTAASITASAGGTSTSATYTINPAAMSSVSLSPTSVLGGVANSTATVTLTSPAGSNGTVVTLGSSNTSAATLPASVTVAVGQKTATVTVTSKAVNSNASVTITGTSGVSKTATLTVTAATLSGLTLSASTIQGNSSNTVTGTVTLSGPAGPSGAVVTLKSSNTTVAPIAASVTVAAGATTATFTIKPTKVTANTAVTITSTYGTTSKTASLTVTP